MHTNTDVHSQTSHCVQRSWGLYDVLHVIKPELGWGSKAEKGIKRGKATILQIFMSVDKYVTVSVYLVQKKCTYWLDVLQMFFLTLTIILQGW